jgi:hypothetical protein
MFAKTEDLDVFNNHQFIMSFMKDRAVNNIPHILLVALCKEKHRLSISFRCSKEPFTGGVFAETFEDSLDCARELRKTLSSLFGCFFESLACSTTYMLSVPPIGSEGMLVLGLLNPSKSMTGLGDRVPGSGSSGEASSRGSLAALLIL